MHVFVIRLPERLYTYLALGGLIAGHTGNLFTRAVKPTQGHSVVIYSVHVQTEHLSWKIYRYTENFLYSVNFKKNVNPLSASSFKCLMLGDGGGSSLYLHHPFALSCSHFYAISEIHVISLWLYVYFYIMHVYIADFQNVYTWSWHSEG